MDIDTTKARVYRINKISVGDKFYVASVADIEIGDSDLIGEVIEVGSKNIHNKSIWTKCCNFMTLEAYYLIKIEEKNMKKEFTKADMKDGMRFVLRNGNEHYWCDSKDCPMIGGGRYDVYEKCYLTDDLFNDDGDRECDVMEVYALGELVWKRSEEQEESEEKKQLKKLQQTIEKAQEQIDKILSKK